MCYRNTSYGETTFDRYFFEKDLFGNIVAVYSEAGTKVASYCYDAWGNCTVLTNTNGIGTMNPFRYRGYYLDTETNLYYLQSRYYDSYTGRFINADDAGNLGAGNELLSYNLFSYCANNPVMRIDPTGEFALTATALTTSALVLVLAIVLITAVYVTVAIAIETSKSKSDTIVDVKPGVIDRFADNSPRVHHIVAKAAAGAEEARKVLEKYHINVVVDPNNLVVIPHGYHKSMHTKRYYQYVNQQIKACNSKEEVYATLNRLRLEILWASQTGIAPWH